MPPTECINHGTCCILFILTLTSRKTTSTAFNHSLHQHSPVTTRCISVYQSDSGTHFNCMHLPQDSASSVVSMLSSTFKVGSFFFNAYQPTDSMPFIPEVTFLLFHISDGSAQFQEDSSDAERPGLHPMGDSP